jgi:hypothetical protein
MRGKYVTQSKSTGRLRKCLALRKAILLAQRKSVRFSQGTVTRWGRRKDARRDASAPFLCFVLEINAVAGISCRCLPYGTLYPIVRSPPDGTPAAQGIGLSQPFLVPSVGLHLAARPAACQGTGGCTCLTPF